MFDFALAEARIRASILETPLISTDIPGLLLKCEHEQVTGSFKARGAVNKVAQLTPEQLLSGIVAASAGNHGLGVAYAARQAGAKSTIVVPDDAVETKVNGIRALGSEVISVPGGFGEAEAHGLILAEERGAVWISPYNDLDVIEGQGTLGVEIDRQIRSRDGDPAQCDVYVPVSGGGLISGAGLALKSLGNYRVIGVQTQAAPYMAAFLAGEDPDSVKELPTLADGLSGPVERGSITFDLLQDAVDEMILVGEPVLLRTLKLAWSSLRVEIEPSSAVPLAAAIEAGGDRCRVVVLSGGNIAPDLRSTLEEGRALADES